MPPDRLYNKAADVAMLRILLWDGEWHVNSSIVREAIDLLGWRRVEGSITTGMHSTLRAMADRGILDQQERRKMVEYRIADGANIRQITGGIDPCRLDADDIGDLDLPGALVRPVVFEPDAFMKQRTREARVAAAIQQCPSPWDYAQRLKRA